MRRIGATLVLGAIAAVIAAVPSEAAVIDPITHPIARFSCAATSLECEPCPEHCTHPTGSVAPGVAVAFDGRPSGDDRNPDFVGTVTGWSWSYNPKGTEPDSQPA